MYIHAYKKISCKSSDWQKKIEQCQEAEKKYRANWKSTHPPIKNQMVRPLSVNQVKLMLFMSTFNDNFQRNMLLQPKIVKTVNKWHASHINLTYCIKCNVYRRAMSRYLF
jgi:hypothetical protein